MIETGPVTIGMIASALLASDILQDVGSAESYLIFTVFLFFFVRVYVRLYSLKMGCCVWKDSLPSSS